MLLLIKLLPLGFSSEEDFPVEIQKYYHLNIIF